MCYTTYYLVPMTDISDKSEVGTWGKKSFILVLGVHKRVLIC